MKPKRFDISDITKSGLSSHGEFAAKPGLRILKNLKTNGTYLVPCKTEAFESSTLPRQTFIFGNRSFYLEKGDDYSGVFEVGRTSISLSWDFVGKVKILNFVKLIILQDIISTYFFNGQIWSRVNPSGRAIPVANSLVAMHGQLIAGGPTSATVGGMPYIDSTCIAWSAIGSDSFELSKENTSGYFNPDIGIIRDVLPMKESALILGDAGSCLMYYAKATFGFKGLELPKFKGSNLCAFAKESCLYIDEDNNLIALDVSGKMQNLDFAWLLADVVSVEYFKARNWYVFSTLTNSFVLDNKGMFSLGYVLYGEGFDFLFVGGGFEQDSFEFSSTYVDLSKAGIKELSEIYIRDTSLSNLRYASATTEEGYSQGLKLLNRHYATKYNLRGDAFSISYKSEAPPVISAIQIEVADTDKRFGAGYLPYKGV